MDPSRKRKLRLYVALSVAILLAGALVYTSFSASTQAKEPSDLLASAEPGRSYELTGKVVADSVDKDGERLTFRIRDRDGRESLPVTYAGVVPDPFREGREIVIDVKKQGAIFEGQPDTLVTKCPSKFTAEPKT